MYSHISVIVPTVDRVVLTALRCSMAIAGGIPSIRPPAACPCGRKTVGRKARRSQCNAAAPPQRACQRPGSSSPIRSGQSPPPTGPAANPNRSSAGCCGAPPAGGSLAQVLPSFEGNLVPPHSLSIRACTENLRKNLRLVHRPDSASLHHHARHNPQLGSFALGGNQPRPPN